MPISIYLAREDNTTQQQKIKEMGKKSKNRHYKLYLNSNGANSVR
jgi:hypothetical protein